MCKREREREREREEEEGDEEERKKESHGVEQNSLTTFEGSPGSTMGCVSTLASSSSSCPATSSAKNFTRDGSRDLMRWSPAPPSSAPSTCTAAANAGGCALPRSAWRRFSMVAISPVTKSSSSASADDVSTVLSA